MVRETPEARAAVQAHLDALLAAMRDGPTARSLAPYLVARGGDEAREWRVPADPVRERAWVENVLRELARLPLGAGYRIDEFVVEPESEGTWHVLRVEFDDPERTEAEFAFLPIGEGFLLGDL